MVKVTVVIPTHNRKASLRKSVRSVFSQTVPPEEIIVVDDSSTEVLDESIFSKAPVGIRCRLLKNEENRGANYCRNIGILSSNSDVICFLDDDDTFDSRKVELVKKAANSNPSADVFYHPARVRFPNEGVGFVTKPKSVEDQDAFLKELIVKNIVGGTPMVSARKEALLECGGFDEKLGRFQDYELWLRLAIAGKRFFLMEEPLTNYNYFSREKSITRSYGNTQEAIDYVRKKHELHYDKLSANELKEHAYWVLKTFLRAAILNYDRYSIIRFQIMLLRCRPSLMGILSAPVIVISPKLAILAQAKLSGG
tara:strand:- start:4639 stop:5568 length:930 start_codon:yes stop_codon:yes gene_type:complete